MPVRFRPRTPNTGNDMNKVRNVDVKLVKRAVRGRNRQRAAKANYLQFIKKSAHSSAG